MVWRKARLERVGEFNSVIQEKNNGTNLMISERGGLESNILNYFNEKWFTALPLDGLSAAFICKFYFCKVTALRQKPLYA